MKKIIYLLIGLSIILSCARAIADLPEQSKTASHKIKKAFWYAKGGKINLTKGAWHFGIHEKILKTKNQEVTDADFSFFCVFTIVNNSTANYKVNPSLMLLNGERATVYRVPPAEYYSRGEEYRRRYDKRRLFKPEILVPGESFVFEDSFAVSRETVSKVEQIKLELGLEEIK